MLFVEQPRAECRVKSLLPFTDMTELEEREKREEEEEEEKEKRR